MPPKVAGQTYCLQKLKRATTTVDVPKTLLKCQSLSDQGSLERLKTVAETLPHNVEIWQAYFSNLLEINGKDRALTAINEAVAKYPANKSMQLLRLRLESPEYPSLNLGRYGVSSSDKLVASFPEYMHPELHFHIAVNRMYLCANDFNYEGFRNELDRDIFAARCCNVNPPWGSQLVALEAAYEYGRKNDTKAIELLESALALAPVLAAPLYTEGVKLLVLILKSPWNDDERADVLKIASMSTLFGARPKIVYSSADESQVRRRIVRELMSSMVPGVDIGAPILGGPVLGVDDIHQLVADARLEREDC